MSQSPNLNLSIESFMENTRKCAAVFPIFKKRDKEEALKEAHELETELVKSAGYGLWRCQGRNTAESEPRSISSNDIEGFSKWFVERKRLNDIDGVFIMLMYHYILKCLKSDF